MTRKFASGDIEGAKAASKSAKCWSIAGLVIGLLLYVLAIGTIVFYAGVIVNATDSDLGLDFGSY